MTECYYVYSLSDPRTDEVFYVGKGQGRRALQHERAVRNGRSDSNFAKNERIRSIVAEGLSVTVQVLETFADEAEAIRAEARHIAATPGLLNIMSNGAPQSTLARLKGHQQTMKVACDRIMPFARWQARYPDRDPRIYWDVRASHLELYEFFGGAIAREESVG